MPRDPIKSLQSLQRQLPAMALHAMEVTMQEAEAQGKRTTAFQNQTGRLRRSIRGSIVAATQDHVIGALSAGDQDAQPGRAGWETPSAEYGPYIELGTSRRSPHPFVRPTILQIAGQNVLGRAMRVEFRSFHP
mgnify:CR=1 FL=1